MDFFVFIFVFIIAGLVLGTSLLVNFFPALPTAYLPLVIVGGFLLFSGALIVPMWVRACRVSEGQTTEKQNKDLDFWSFARALVVSCAGFMALGAIGLWVYRWDQAQTAGAQSAKNDLGQVVPATTEEDVLKELGLAEGFVEGIISPAVYLDGWITKGSLWTWKQGTRTKRYFCGRVFAILAAIAFGLIVLERPLRRGRKLQGGTTNPGEVRNPLIHNT